MSDLEAALLWQIKRAKLPVPYQEWRFAPPRRWRLDFAWPDRKIGVEVEGGSWVGGRHTRGAGFEADCEKYGMAAEFGWRIFRYTAAHVDNGYALAQIERVLAA